MPAKIFNVGNKVVWDLKFGNFVDLKRHIKENGKGPFGVAKKMVDPDTGDLLICIEVNGRIVLDPHRNELWFNSVWFKPFIPEYILKRIGREEKKNVKKVR